MTVVYCNNGDCFGIWTNGSALFNFHRLYPIYRRQNTTASHWIVPGTVNPAAD